MANKINILVTGVVSPGGPGLLELLNKTNKYSIHACDANESASGRFLKSITSFTTIPRSDDKSFIPAIKDICLKNKIINIIPLVTKELLKLSEHRKDFEILNTKILVSEFEDLKIANNKCELYNHLKKNKIKTPEYAVISNSRELDRKYSTFPLIHNKLVIKPCSSNGSRGVRIIDSEFDSLDSWLNKKPSNLSISIENFKKIIANQKIPKLLLSEYLPGKEVTVDTIVNKGKVIDCIIRERSSMNNGISTSGKFVEDENIYEYVKKIISTLPGLFGPIGFQLKQDINGEYKLLESNPRLQGTSSAAIGLGLNLPDKCLDLLNGKNLLKHQFKSGISFSRYYQEIFYES